MEVIKDLIDGSSISQSLSGGLKITRAFLVTDVTGNATSRLSNALDAPGIPAVRDYHPNVSKMVCSEITADAINGDNSQFKVICNYTPEILPVSGNSSIIQFGSTVQSVQSSMDKNGVDILLGPFNFVDTNGAQHTVPEQFGIVNRMYSNPVLSFERTETLMQTLFNNVIDYVGKVNSTTFFGCSAEKILCTRIYGSSSDGGVTYKATYEFQVNLNEWKADVVYRDESTGYPHKKATVENNGKKRVSIYKQADFNLLRLQ